jgi:predicted ATPase
VATARFAAAAVARLEELRLGALEDRIDADLATGGHDAVLAELDELVTEHPLRERLCGQLMRALAAAGRQADALAAYQRLRRLLAEDLGIDPSEELQAVHLEVLRGEAAPAAPPRTNLRAQITSFVGRDDDLARITGALADARLVTLTGPGGAGKTRLAGEAAARLLERMPGGVWMVELGSVTSPDDLPQALLSLFGAREIGLLAPLGATAVAPLERLEEAIGGKRLLLVMDNCEHLVAAVAALVDRLLGRCPALAVLATSREPLGLPGEVLHPVGPLALPAEDVAPAEAARYPAVRLFADRGAAARPGFAVDQATLSPVLRICRALDGIPLAIELAAARLRALSPEQIAGRLDDRFRLLADGSRRAMARHQTLRAVVDWSWDLLGDDERVLLRRLAVFAGGATLAAVERVCAGPGLGGPARGEVLYLLAALVDKSLVVAGEDGEPGEVRYRLLETVRAYGEERRREAGEDEALRRAHAAYFLDLAERADPMLRGGDQLRWIDRLSAERDNLRAALRFTVDAPDAAVAVRLVVALGWYWLLRSARAEATGWVAQVEPLASSDEVPAALRAQLLAYGALLSLGGGLDVRQALAAADEAMAILAGLAPEEPRRLHPVLLLLPVFVAMFRSEDALALARVRELHHHPDPWARAAGHLLSGGLLVNLGEARQAEAELRLALEGFREVGERWGIGQALFALAELSATRGQFDAAVVALEEAEGVFVGLGNREDLAQLVIRRAWARAEAGEVEQGLEDLETADRLADEVGAEDLKLFVLLARGEFARWQGRLDAARELLDAAIARFERSERPADQMYALMLASRGRVDAAAGDLEGARGWHRRALEAAVGTRDGPVIARTVELLADLTLAAGDAERAAELLGTAEALRGMPDEADPDVARLRAAARAALGDRGFALAHRRGAARRRDDVLAALAAEVSSAAGTPAAPAGRTPPR